VRAERKLERRVTGFFSEYSWVKIYYCHRVVSNGRLTIHGLKIVRIRPQTCSFLRDWLHIGSEKDKVTSPVSLLLKLSTSQISLRLDPLLLE